MILKRMDRCGSRLPARLATSLTLAFLCSGMTHAAGITVIVTDAAGLPVPDAVVYAEPTGGQALPKVTRAAEIEQKGRRFAPLVTVIQAGTDVSFPNNDTVRHQVYSFSTPKVFELKLYSGTPGSPIMFDKPGTVVVGCNIHDQMLAYIHVVGTPYFARTDAAGRAHLDGVVAGKYSLKLWHYKMTAPAQIQEQAMLMTTVDTSVALKLLSKPTASN